MSGFGGTSAPSSGGLFGTTSSAGSTGGGLFKAATPSAGFQFGQPSGSTFGSTNENKDGAQPSIFGGGKGLFGGGTGTTQSNLFGQQTGTSADPKPSMFGQQSSTSADSKPNLFGQQPSSGTSSGSIFGKTDTSNKPVGNSFSFGSAAQTPGTPNQSSAPKGLFSPNTPAPASTSNFFTRPSTTPAGQPPTSVLGASTGGSSSQPQTQAGTQGTSFFTQNQSSASNAKPGIFGSGTSNLFSPQSGDSSSQPSTTFGGGFKLGQSDKPAEATASKPEPPKSLFTTATTSSAPASTPSFTNQFSFNPSGTSSSSTPSQPASSQPTGFNVITTSSGQNQASTATTQASSGGIFNLGGSSDKPSFFTKPAPPSTQAAEQPKSSAPLFPTLGTTQTTASASQPTSAAPTQAPLFSGFNLGGQSSNTTSASTAPAATASAPAPPFNLGSAPPTTATSAASTSAAAPTASAAPAKSPLGTVSTPGFGASTLGASTTGPVPPAQSRLRNRTMDEILTRWASDLTRYTKEFKGHAEQVAHWDQIIVDNSSKIDKLYVKTRTCEKQTMSVEMQLSAVENQQNELEAWLSKYEGDVEEMLAKDGTAQSEPGGPDQERERTYQLAEKLNERLDDMGRDLQSMIEEVNAANAGLGKTSKVDEPITQIVKILNAHLSQLQAIDQGTAALQAKVSAAQKAASGINYLNSSTNGDQRGAVDDFYRSYMGRR